MSNKTFFLHELPPFTVCKTKLAEKPKTYIFLGADETHYTVYTNEKHGFVMTANNKSISKRIQVEILFERKDNPTTLFDFSYPDAKYEALRKKAIDYFFMNEKKLKPQAKNVFQSWKALRKIK